MKNKNEYINESEKQAAPLRARIASLRSRLSLGIESFEITQTQKFQNSREGKTNKECMDKKQEEIK